MQAETLLARVRTYALADRTIEGRGAWLRQEGEMRLAPGGRWLPFTAEEWFFGGGIEFRWQAKVRMAPLMSVRVVDGFARGEGRLTARILGVLPVARARGAATDKGEAMRGLAELPWRPFGFREGPHVRWEAAESGRLRASFDDGKTQAAVEFEVDGEGQVRRGNAASRPRMVGKRMVETPWSGVFGAYERIDGVRLPTTAEVTWLLAEGPFTYWRCRVTGFRMLR